MVIKALGFCISLYLIAINPVFAGGIGRCSDDTVASLRKRFSDSQVHVLCGATSGSYNNGPFNSTERRGSMCKTRVSVCPLGEEGPVGAPCVCELSSGPITGIIEPGN
jgi:hypothetical protein